MVETNPESSSPPPRAAVGFLVALALLVRLVVLFARQDALAKDPDSYREVAANLLSHGTFGHALPPGVPPSEQHSYPESGETVSPTAHRPPLYPLLLAPAMLMGTWSYVGIAALHLALGVGTVWLVSRVALSWGLSRFASLAAAALVACDPILLNQSAEVMTETAATFLTVALLAAWTQAWHRVDAASCPVSEAARRRFYFPDAAQAAAWAGAIAGLAILCRPTFFPVAVCGAVLFTMRSKTPRPRLGACYLLAVAAVVSPWVIRNQLVFGRAILTTTHGGHTLRLANNAEYYAHVRANPLGTVWDSRSLEKGDVSDDEARAANTSREVLLDRRNYALAIDEMLRDPTGFGWATFDRLAKTWRLAPAEQPSEGGLRRALRWGVGLWYLAEYVLVGVGIFALGRRVVTPPWLFGILLIAAFTLAHAFFWTDMRMRAPLAPVICLLAAVGMERAFLGARGTKSV